MSKFWGAVQYRSEPNHLDRKRDKHGERASDVMVALGIERAFHVGTSGAGWMILKLAQVDVQMCHFGQVNH